MSNSELNDLVKLSDKFKFDEEKEKSKQYIFKCDIEHFSSLHDKFVLSVLPHQWWGSVLNPKIVFLALNPGYSIGNDELDSIVFKDFIINNYKLNNYKRGRYLFDDELKGIDGLSFEYSSISRWWRKVFCNFIPNNSLNEYSNYFVDSKDYKEKIDRFNNRIGFFNLVGYQGKDSNYIHKGFNCDSTKLIAHM